MHADVIELARQARGGWVTSSGTLEEVKAAARRAGWHTVPNRSGESGEKVLLPKTRKNAALRSLSRIYGMGAQPLHTDGAHLAKPPDLIVLWSEEPNLTSTLTWSARHSSDTFPYSELRNGLFLVDAGRQQFLAHSYEHGAFRYDPGCMSPADARAKKAAEYFRSVIADAYKHDWTERNMLLFIDNKRALHARGAIDEADRDSRQLVRLAFHTEVL